VLSADENDISELCGARESKTQESLCRSTSEVNSPWQNEVSERNMKPETRGSGARSRSPQRPLKELAPLPSCREVWITCLIQLYATYVKAFHRSKSCPWFSIPSEPARKPGHAVSLVSCLSKFEFCDQRTNGEPRILGSHEEFRSPS
jgi:hypothetical protein